MFRVRRVRLRPSVPRSKLEYVMADPKKFVGPAVVLQMDAPTIEISAEWPLESIIALCAPVYDDDSGFDEVSRAMATIQSLLDELLTSKTEALRGALTAMVNAHHRRTAVSGRCGCNACMTAVRLLESGN